jgi:hypothetical protein
MPDPCLHARPKEAELLDAPSGVTKLTPDERASLRVKLAALAAALDACPADGAPAMEDPAQPLLVTVDEAAHLTGVTHDAFLRRQRFRPAVVRLGHRTRRVDVKKLRGILERMRP